jgi:hypothetical protein
MPSKTAFLLLFFMALRASAAVELKWRELLWAQALKQSERVTDEWDPSQRDCAGFVRFLYRTTVTGRAKMWLDASGERREFVSAQDLVRANFERVSREARGTKIQTGDLLVYFRPEYPKEEAWHVMVVLAPNSLTAQEPLVIYHNGARGADARIRKVWLSSMESADWSIWRPVRGNPRFQGVYRWKGWEDPAFREKAWGGK